MTPGSGCRAAILSRGTSRGRGLTVSSRLRQRVWRPSVPLTLSERVCRPEFVRPGLSGRGHSPSPFDRVHRCPLPNCVLDWPPTGCTMKPPMPRCSPGCAPVPPPSVNWACSCTVGRTHDAIVREGMLQGYSGLIRYPYGREGGLMKLVARVTEGRDGQAPFDGAIYLIDPVDPSSIFPRRWRSSGSASPTVARSFRRWPAPSNGWRSNACTRA